MSTTESTARIYITVKVEDRPGSKVAVRPETVRASEVAKIATEVEAMLESFASAIGLELPSEVPVSLIDIQDGSDRLKFSMTVALVPLVALLVTAINNHSFDEVPRDAYRHLHALSAWGSDRRWAIEFVPDSRSGLTGATLEPDSVLPPPPPSPIVKGDTTLYGRVVRVGGKETPTARVVPLQGGPDVTVTFKSESLAKRAARYLYETVGVEGVASWEAETGQVCGLVAARLFPLGTVGPAATFERLRAKVDGQLDRLSAEQLVGAARESTEEG